MYDVFLTIKFIDVFLILIIVVLFFFCLFLLYVIKNLKEKLFGLEIENKNILERKVMKQNDIDVVSIQNISEEKINLNPSREEFSFENSLSSRKIAKNGSQCMEEEKFQREGDISFKGNSSIRTNMVDDKDNYIKIGDREKSITQNQYVFSMNGNYQKSELQNKNRVISPVSISLEDSFDMNQFSFDLNEFVKKTEKVVPKIRIQSSTEDYLKELSDQMANELKTQTIELTDYEKEQEEHAIISYQELLAIKNQLDIVDDEEKTIDFIEDLKNLKNRLN